jgi:hypothetical protein
MWSCLVISSMPSTGQNSLPFSEEKNVIKNDQEGPVSSAYAQPTVCKSSDFACCFYVKGRLHLCNLRLLCDITPLSFHSTNLRYLNIPAFGNVIANLLALSSNFGTLMETVDDRPADIGSFLLRRDDGGFLCSVMGGKCSRRLWCSLLDAFVIDTVVV